jgi:very-short-patch-repair endonuclease
VNSRVKRARSLIHRASGAGIHRFWSREHDPPTHPQTLPVRARHQLPVALTQLAEAQAGVVSRKQVHLLGVSDAVTERLLREGRWQSVASGIYHIAPSPPTWDGLAWAGVLIGGDGARLGPQASGYLHNLKEDAPRPVDVLIPVGRSARIGGEWRFSRERPGARSPRSVHAPPRLTIEDTVLDLSSEATEGDLVGLVTKAVQSRRTTPRRLLKAMNERSRYKHRKLLIDILGDVAAGAESPLEMKFVHQVERPHGLPRGNRQRRRHGLPYISDVGYDAYRLLVELDGRAGHEGTGRFRDMNRDNQFALIEWITLRYGWYDVVHRPCVVAFQIAAALAARGWNGLPTRCFRCSNATDLDLLG